MQSIGNRIPPAGDRRFGAALLAVLVLVCVSGQALAESVVASSATLRLKVNQDALKAIGVELATAPDGSAEYRSAAGGVLDFDLDTSNGREQRPGGSLLFEGGPVLRWQSGQVDLRVFRLMALADRLGSLQITDADETPWLVMAMGHRAYSDDGRVLNVYVADLRLSSAFAARLNQPELAGLFIGSAEVAIELVEPRVAPKDLRDDLVWPTEPGAVADLALIDIPDVDAHFMAQSMEAGRVIITPSALLQNVGTADLPWYQVFASPHDDAVDEPTDDLDCFDDGNGQCLPYGTDQGGLLAWNLYRLENGRLQQIARSGVKHAFNSTNTNCAFTSARVAYIGCRDLYGSSTNVLQSFLGPRDDIDAFPVIRHRCGSVFDQNCDNRCDRTQAGLIKCVANPAASIFDYRLSVPETDLQGTGRYFMEAWYLVRDDVDIFNSMGYVEVDPTFNGSVWTFPRVGGFISGPVAHGTIPTTFFTRQMLDTGEGRLTVLTREIDLGDRWQYQLSIMNFDFDRQIDRVALAVHPSAQVSNITFVDGDADSGNDWAVAMPPEQLVWSAPTGAGLDWGTMYTFMFESALAPISGGAARLDIGDPGSEPSLQITVSRPAPAGLVFHSGFEAMTGD